ncbi:hypothetical protein KW801_03345 [Candidatus Saccharibacteria bacterium]|nr:hypothetical protein [Candidatus Saccharibacteria bacterium]
MSVDWMGLAPFVLGAIILVAMYAGTNYSLKARHLVGAGRRNALEDAYACYGVAVVLFGFLFFEYPAFRLAVVVVVGMLLLVAVIVLKHLQDADRLSRYSERDKL